MATNSADAIPQKGEIWLTQFGSGRIGEPTKNRPALVMSRQCEGGVSVYELIVVVPLSASVHPSLARPVIKAGGGTGLDEDSVLLPNAMVGLAMSRLLNKFGEVHPRVIREVELAITRILDFGY